MHLCKGDKIYIHENAYIELLEDARSKLSKWNGKAAFHMEDGTVQNIFLKYAYHTDPLGVELLKKESQFQMYYPHIAVVYGSLNGKDAQEQEVFCVLMEHVEGQNLQEFRKNMDMVDEEQMFVQMLQLLYGVQYYMKYVSEDRFVHRDLKPANIMITEKEKKVVIVDFDWAHIHGSSITMQAEAQGRFIGGTAGYADPRAYRSTKTDVKMDLYALGRIFCFWLIGDHYFSQEELEHYAELDEGILFGLNKSRIPKRYHQEAYRFFLDVIIKKMVAPAEERYEDIDHVIADMERFLKEYRNKELVVGEYILNEVQKKAGMEQTLMVRVQFQQAQTVQTYLIENYGVRDIKTENRVIMSVYHVNGKLHYMLYHHQLVKDPQEDQFYLGEEMIRIQYS